VAERAPKAFAASRAWQQLPPLLNSDAAGKNTAAKALELLVLTATAIDTSSGSNGNDERMNPNSPACALQPAVAQILATTATAVNNNDDDAVWERLVQAAEDVPILLQGPALSATLQYCGASNSLMAVQVVVLLLECKTLVEPSVLEHSLATCWNAMVDMEDVAAGSSGEQEWATEAVPLHEDGALVDDENDNAEFA